MPRETVRQRRTQRLLKTFLQFSRLRAKHLRIRNRRRERWLRRLDEGVREPSPEMDIDDMGNWHQEFAAESSQDSDSDLGDTSLSSESSSLTSGTTTTDLSFSDISDTSSDSDGDTSSVSSIGGIGGDGFGSGGDLGSDWDSSMDWELEYTMEHGESDGSLDDLGASQLVKKLGQFVRREIEGMHSTRYEVPRLRIPRAPGQLQHTLQVLKLERPDHFRQELRLSPLAFDRLVTRLEKDLVFTNNSPNPQIPVEDQLAITLYRFRHDGNAASLDSVARWSGYGKGTVHLATRRTMIAILRKDFIGKAVQLPTAAEKEDAKRWIETHSCKGWRDGWCMVDGTLIPLYDRPYWYGESYFDRKCNYSLNIQIISLPNLRIIDYGYGFTGSTHNSTAWEKTYVFEKHSELFKDGEFIWGDSAYPLESWVVAPYKKPESEVPENTTFNNQVSMLRIRSEHAIGFLKGRFQSLKNLRVNIRDKESHQYATFWVVCCIGLHNFAMGIEAEEGTMSGENDDLSPENTMFIREGLTSSSLASDESDLDVNQEERHSRSRRAPALLAGRARREELKSILLRACRRREEVRNLESEDSESDSVLIESEY